MKSKKIEPDGRTRVTAAPQTTKRVIPQQSEYQNCVKKLQNRTCGGACIRNIDLLERDTYEGGAVGSIFASSCITKGIVKISFFLTCYVCSTRAMSIVQKRMYYTLERRAENYTCLICIDA